MAMLPTKICIVLLLVSFSSGKILAVDAIEGGLCDKSKAAALVAAKEKDTQDKDFDKKSTEFNDALSKHRQAEGPYLNAKSDDPNYAALKSAYDAASTNLKNASNAKQDSEKLKGVRDSDVEEKATAMEGNCAGRADKLKEADQSEKPKDKNPDDKKTADAAKPEGKDSPPPKEEGKNPELADLKEKVRPNEKGTPATEPKSSDTKNPDLKDTAPAQTATEEFKDGGKVSEHNLGEGKSVEVKTSPDPQGGDPRFSEVKVTDSNTGQTNTQKAAGGDKFVGIDGSTGKYDPATNSYEQTSGPAKGEPAKVGGLTKGENGYAAANGQGTFSTEGSKNQLGQFKDNAGNTYNYAGGKDGNFNYVDPHTGRVAQLDSNGNVQFSSAPQQMVTQAPTGTGTAGGSNSGTGTAGAGSTSTTGDDALDQAAATVTGAQNALLPKPAADALSAAQTGAGNWFGETFPKTAETLGNAVNSGLETIQNGAKYVSDAAQSTWEAAKSAWNTVTDPKTYGYSGTASPLDNAANAVTSVQNKVLPPTVSQPLSSAQTALGNAVGTTFPKTTLVVTGAVDTAIGAVQSTAQATYNGAAYVGNAAYNGASAAWNWATDWW